MEALFDKKEYKQRMDIHVKCISILKERVRLIFY